jgi:hypothetical protein
MFEMSVKQIKSWFKYSKTVFVKKSGGITYVVRKTHVMVLIKEFIQGYSPCSISQIISITEKKLGVKLKLIYSKTVKSKRRIIIYYVYEIHDISPRNTIESFKYCREKDIHGE